MLFMQGVFFGLCGLTNTAPGLSPQVEVTVAEKGSTTLVQLVNSSGHFGTSFYKPLPVREAVVTIPLPKAPAAVRTLYKKDNTSYSYERGFLNLTVTLLDEYEAIVIE